MATDDLIVTGAQLGVGTTDKLSTLTVRSRGSFELTGTVTKIHESATVIGLGTSFQTQLTVGDRITVPGGGFDETKTVIAIVSDTELNVDSPFGVTESEQTVTVLPSAVRVDDRTGATQIVVNDQGSIGLGTIAPTAQLDVTGPGTGDFAGCPVHIRAHSPECGDAWGLVLSHETNGISPGVAIWVDDFAGDGTPTLSYSFYDGQNTMVDTMRMDPNGILMQAGWTIGPTIVIQDYEISPIDQYVYVSGGHTVTLPPVGSAGRVLWIFKKGGAGDVTITPHTGEQINGSTSSKTITTDFEGIKLVALWDMWVASVVTAA